MSDNAPADERAEATAETETVSSGRFGDLNPLYVLFGALVGIAVLALLWFAVLAPLLGGDEPQPDEVAQPTPTVTAPVPSPTPGATPGQPPLDEEVDLPLETFEVFLARDPFRPVRPAAAPPADADGGPPPIPGDGAPGVPGDGDGPPTDTDGDGIPDDGTDGDGTDGDGTDGDGTDGDGTQPPKEDEREDRATVEGHEVELIDILTEDDRRRVVVRVDDESFTVEVGETFAERFRLLSIDGSCATFLYGDNRFTLCEGERVLK